MIQMEPEDIERIRERLRKMSDLELRQWSRCQRLIQSEEELWPTESFVPGSIRRGESRVAEAASLRFCRDLARRPRVQFTPPPLNRFRSY
jgi:hypothetical protein